MKFRRLTTTVLLAAAALLGAAAGVLTPGSRAATATPPRAQLTQFSCVRALDAVNRSVAVWAVMRPLPGTRRLALRFDLLVQVPGSAAVVVHTGDLGRFRSPPNPTLGQLPKDVWRRQKQVLNLSAPAGYQFRVTFRWTGVHGRVLGTATRYSQVCHEPELRPDLLVSSIAVSPIAGRPAHELYTADLVNQGATGAGPFEVLFTPGDGSAPVIHTVKWLGAHQTTQVAFTGPVCDPAAPSQVTADSASQVDDVNRANNTTTAVCPATG
ncbi:MAG: CARDB domain-containing protein [Solirubrobacteraceae bacterium]